MNRSMPGSPSIINSRVPPKPMSIELVMPSNHLILCHPRLLLPSIFPSIRVFSSELVLRIRWPKYWSFSFSFSPFNKYLGLVFFRMDWLIYLQSKGFSRLLQHYSINSSVLSLPYGPAFTSVHNYWTNHSFDYMDLCHQSDVTAF